MEKYSPIPNFLQYEDRIGKDRRDFFKDFSLNLVLWRDIEKDWSWHCEKLKIILVADYKLQKEVLSVLFFSPLSKQLI